jgi:hypothetical protein
MIKLTNILSEAYAWERQEGKSLPTLAEVQAAYQAKMREDAKPDFLDLDDDGDEEESMKSAAKDVDDDNDPEPEKWSTDKLEPEPEPYKYDPYDDDDDDYYMDEAAKPDFLDLDGDGNETESMKSAAADTTTHGNVINRARAKFHLNKKDCSVYGHDASDKATKLNSTSDVDKVDSKGKLKYKKFTIKTESLAESFKKRMIGNLKGSEYILSETFKRK